MNHNIVTLKLRRTAFVALGGLAASGLFACGGDNTPVVEDSGGGDGAAMDSISTTDARSERDSATPMDAPSGDTPSGDTSTQDSTISADSGNDAADAAVRMDTGNAADSERDAGADTTIADAADAAPIPLVPLNLCPVLDTDWGLTNADYTVRATSWGPDISEGSSTNSFAAALTNDCLVQGLHGFVGMGQPIVDYLNQLNVFTLQFFGCGVPDAGALSFSSLIPAMAQGHTFTVADLNEVAKVYLNSTIAEASFNWAAVFSTTGMTPSPEPLTSDQINQIQAQLAALEAAMPGVNPSTTHYTLANCDAGSDAGGDAADDGAGDAGTGDSGSSDSGDAGTDSGTD